MKPATKVRDLFPGCWEDASGAIHFNLPELHAACGISDNSPASLSETAAILQKVIGDFKRTEKSVILRTAIGREPQPERNYVSPAERLYKLGGLDGRKPVPCGLWEWSTFFANGAPIVRQDRINKNILVSTMFLGIDHEFKPKRPPLVFETLVFNGLTRMRRLYSTWEQAEAGHQQVLQTVLATQ